MKIGPSNPMIVFVVIDRLDVERSLVRLVDVVKLELRRIGALVLVYRLLDVRLKGGDLLFRLFELRGGHELRGAAGGHNRRAVGGFDDHLQVGLGGRAGNILQGETVDVSLIRYQIQGPGRIAKELV
jgi:hypothetical protein